MSEKGGIAGIAAAAVAGAGAALAADQAAAAADQLDLLAPPTRLTGDRAAQVQRTLSDHHRARGGGRPPGAQNLATRQMREYLLARGVHPLENLMRWALHTPETLSTELGCTLLEAFRELKAVWAELAPYFAAKVAPTDDKGNALPLFNLQIGGSTVAVGADGMPPWLADPEVRRAMEESERNQRVIDARPEQSHGESRTDDASD